MANVIGIDGYPFVDNEELVHAYFDEDKFTGFFRCPLCGDLTIYNGKVSHSFTKEDHGDLSDE